MSLSRTLGLMAADEGGVSVASHGHGHGGHAGAATTSAFSSLLSLLSAPVAPLVLGPLALPGPLPLPGPLALAAAGPGASCAGVGGALGVARPHAPSATSTSQVIICFICWLRACLT
ncbi:MAG: hypothetical protein IPI49_15800 [Myxococcales bacterium]|nr:hypothetical protein [Myxococcales bacterium]